MNILFVLYGDFTSNSANPLVLYARELRSAGHACAVAVPSSLETVSQHDDIAFLPVLYDDVLKAPHSLFPNSRLADVIHACTPREVVRRFVTSYLSKHPTPLVIYLEDNEEWIATRALGLTEETLGQVGEQEISDRLSEALAHPFRYRSFIGLADAVAVIQDKLRSLVPPWVHAETVMIGVDVELFSPRAPLPPLRARYGVAENEKVIVYHGGLNQFNQAAIQDLCAAVGILRQQGYLCRLLRTGPNPLSFLAEIPRETALAVSDLGLLRKRDLPDLLALADVFVQPGQPGPFEDFRLPGKVPEFLAMGLPVILPLTHGADLFTDGVDAVLLKTGSPQEIAGKSAELFSNPERARAIGKAGRRLAEIHFDARVQGRRLEAVYQSACRIFDAMVGEKTWRTADSGAPVVPILARKLRLLADQTSLNFVGQARDLLKEYARHIESTQHRINGLEWSLLERNRQIAELRQTIEGVAESKSWGWKLKAQLYRMRWVLRRLSKEPDIFTGNQKPP
jgi:glycosyltransferase involved in cell wall biosynthesis